MICGHSTLIMMRRAVMFTLCPRRQSLSTTGVNRICTGGCSIKIGLRRRPINPPSRRPIRIFMEQLFWKADSQIGFREGWFSRTRIGLREGQFSRIGLPARLALGLVFLEGWFSNRLSGKLINQPSPKANFYGTASCTAATASGSSGARLNLERVLQKAIRLTVADRKSWLETG